MDKYNRLNPQNPRRNVRVLGPKRFKETASKKYTGIIPNILDSGANTSTIMNSKVVRLLLCVVIAYKTQPIILFRHKY